MQRLVAYKPLAYKPAPSPPSEPLCQALYLPQGQTDSPHFHQHINKHLLNFIQICINVDDCKRIKTRISPKNSMSNSSLKAEEQFVYTFQTHAFIGKHE